MTTVAVLLDPPRPGAVFPRLVETSPLTDAEAAALYAAMARDLVAAVDDSGGDLLVNYRPEADVPGDGDAQAEVCALVEDAGVEDPRLEVQVGSTFSGRVGNTLTHLLESEGVGSAAVVEPSAPLLSRVQIDQAAMKLRRNGAVLGPSTGGRVYYAGFAEPIDFGDAYADPAVETLTDRARDAGREVDFLSVLPVVETGRDLATVASLLNARRRAGLAVPSATTEALDEFDLVVDPDDKGLSLRR